MPAVQAEHKIVTVHRASDINGRKVEPCSLVIGENTEVRLGRVPSLAEAKLVYDAEAVLIADVLVEHLPQATLDRVLLRLMEKKVEKTFYRGPLS